MNIVVERLNKIKSNISNSNVNVVAVSKTFPFETIKPLIDQGHLHFGENKVQEAEAKWSEHQKTKKKLIYIWLAAFKAIKQKRQ